MNSWKHPAVNNRAVAPSIVVFCFLASADMAQAEPIEPPLGGAALETWLKAGHYKTWRRESGAHASPGPHFGKVRAYLNPVLFESKARQHPKEAAAVKELYGDGEAVLGWSVAIKTQADSDGGSNWYWYEIFQNKVKR